MSIQADKHAVLRLRTRETLRVGDPIEIDLDQQVVKLTGTEPDSISFDDLKAIFFFGPPGTSKRPDRGSHLTIEFDDGEVISGVAPEYNPTHPGFYLYPENEDRVEKVFIVSSAIVSIDVDRL